MRKCSAKQLPSLSVLGLADGEEATSRAPRGKEQVGGSACDSPLCSLGPEEGPLQ